MNAHYISQAIYSNTNKTLDIGDADLFRVNNEIGLYFFYRLMTTGNKISSLPLHLNDKPLF